MKSLPRLRELRRLQERVAEASLRIARAESWQAAARVVQLGERVEQAREETLRALLDDKAESVYLSELEAAVATAALPRARSRAEEMEARHQSISAIYLDARCNHSMLSVLVSIEDQRALRRREAQEQRLLDEAYVMRRHSFEAEPVGESATPTACTRSL